MTAVRRFTFIEWLIIFLTLTAVTTIVVVVLRHVRAQQRLAGCCANQRQLAIAILAYAQDHGDILPTYHTIWRDVSVNAATLHCPAAPGVANAYVYHGALSGLPLRTIGNPASTVVTADGASLWSGTPNIAYTVLSLSPRHNQRVAAAYLDGHTAVGPAATIPIRDMTVSGICWEPQAIDPLARLSLLDGTNLTDGQLICGPIPATRDRQYFAVQSRQVLTGDGMFSLTVLRAHHDADWLLWMSVLPCRYGCWLDGDLWSNGMWGNLSGQTHYKLHGVGLPASWTSNDTFTFERKGMAVKVYRNGRLYDMWGHVTEPLRLSLVLTNYGSQTFHGITITHARVSKLPD